MSTLSDRGTIETVAREHQRGLYAKDWLALFVVTGFVALRFAGAGSDFSYDYIPYLQFLRAVADYPFDEIAGSLRDFAPFVFVPGGGTFEVGFVALSKTYVTFIGDPALAYAAIAASSVALRVASMRLLGAPWLWICVSQIYAVTVFDANAIRAGLAVTVALAGVVLAHRGMRLAGSAVLLSAGLFHLQSFAFALPFLTALPIVRRLPHTLGRVAALSGVAVATSILGIILLPVLGFERATQYIGLPSGAGGLTVTSMSGLAAIALGLSLASVHSSQADTRQETRSVWLATALAAVPAAVLWVAALDVGVIGDRACQFALIIFVAVPWIDWTDSRARKRLVIAALLFLLVISVINVTIRYPLSNMFDFVLPHEFIIPLFLN